ncbi:MAG: FadR family transcriptional regulator [Acidobacteriota bacterium]|nr:FadR family transcriptional regulator [Acidobacteriota bacterium]
MSSEAKAEDLTTRLLADFRALIASGEIKPGTRLPPERELAKRFGASRSSLRPVLKLLENVGVLSQHVGDGTYLKNDATGILSVPLNFLILLDGVSLIEVFEARLMLEPELAARAAQSASGEDLEAMRATLAAFKENLVDADVNFHLAICRATRNRICMRMFEAIHKAFAQGMVLTARLAPERALEFHRLIYTAIHLRNAEESRKLMAEHLTHSKGVLLQAHLENDGK